MKTLIALSLVEALGWLLLVFFGWQTWRYLYRKPTIVSPASASFGILIAIFIVLYVGLGFYLHFRAG